MKMKEIIQLTVALVIFAVSGFIIYTQLIPQKAASKNLVMVEKVTPLEPGFNEDALKKISDSSLYQDFYTKQDLNSGLGNTQPFTNR